jgi:superfamily II DNA helicase RecQ
MSKRFAPLAGLESVDEDRLERALQSFFGFDSFRERQREVCLHVLSPGSRTVCLFPTGAGKSLLFQLSGVVLGGVSLVVSPLVALMQDQVRALQRLCAKSGGQIMADFYSASSSEEEKSRIKSALFNAAASSILPAGKSYIVYVTPEFLLRNPALVNKLVAEKVFFFFFFFLFFFVEKNWVFETNKPFFLIIFQALSLIAIDEAHCVIEFGTDFRPDYLKLGQFMGIPSVRYMALTASVSEETMRQMLASLRMQDARVFKSSFNRPNIFYEVHYADVLGSGDVFDLQKHDMVEWIQAPERAGKSGIVYVRKKTECEEVARFLSEKGVKAEAYHADVKDKSNVQKRWMDNVTQVQSRRETRGR